MVLSSQAPKALALEFACCSGAVRLLEMRRRGTGAMLRFQRVQPLTRGGFQPSRAIIIAPERLERLLGRLRRRGVELVTVDEAVRRIAAPAASRRFVCLTFDGAYRDVLHHAAPVLARHRVPFAVYVPTAFVDGIAELWWLPLERVIARNERISLMLDERERHFDAGLVEQKCALYDLLAGWLQGLAPAERSLAIRDLCTRYMVDLAALSRAAVMDWNEVRALAADPLVTIGSATVHGAALDRLDDAQALREMRMGREVAEAALDRSLPHFAYPSGSIGAREVALAAQAGFASAVTLQGGLIRPDGGSSPLALPRIGWDGRRPSLRALRARLAGLGS
ncbi:polysaccharide deacetylase family protein [Bradyrhizobium sp. 2TAF24]|uniref:polysaccharide deacetylase family protein n=1 Tax=Bradyrhizobium sp. 2TAF24 TaxID=3233011 RepID=UPI003F93E3EF